MCNLYSITTNQAAIIALFRVMNRYVGNLPPIPGVFPDYPAPVVRNAGGDREMVMMRWGMPPPPKLGGAPHRACDQHGVHQLRGQRVGRHRLAHRTLKPGPAGAAQADAEGFERVTNGVFQVQHLALQAASATAATDSRPRS
jgi:hypothetical protein